MPWHGQAGHAAAEFALVAGIMFVFVLAALDLSLATTAKAAVAAAAREGARQAAVDGGDTPAVRQRIADVLKLAGLDASGAAIRIEPKQAGYGRPIRVTVAVSYEVRTPPLRAFTGGRLALSSEAVTRNERVP